MAVDGGKSRHTDWFLGQSVDERFLARDRQVYANTFLDVVGEVWLIRIGDTVDLKTLLRSIRKFLGSTNGIIRMGWNEITTMCFDRQQGAEAVTVYSRIRRQQLIQEAEGYLDLILAVSDPFPLDPSHRDRLAKRAIATLDRLDHAELCHGRAHYLRGQAFRLMEKHHQSIDALLKAADIDPMNIHIQLSLAWCYKRVGRIDLAIQALEDGLEIDPDQGILHYNLACYWSLANNVGLTLCAFGTGLRDELDVSPVGGGGAGLRSGAEPPRVYGVDQRDRLIVYGVCLGAILTTVMCASPAKVHQSLSTNELEYGTA